MNERDTLRAQMAASIWAGMLVSNIVPRHGWNGEWNYTENDWTHQEAIAHADHLLELIAPGTPAGEE
jgi:hypothetical protein